MTRRAKAETLTRNLEYTGPFHQAAVRMREFLNADFAAIATIKPNALVIRALVGVDSADNLVADLSRKVGNWGPMVVDDARLISVPAMRGKRVVAILIGYSSDEGHFTTQDLERLMSFAEEVAGALEEADAVDPALRDSLISGDELLHVSRLVTIGELSACFAHEVVNPLMMIRGNLRFIDEVLPQGDSLRSNFDVIDRASRRIEDMAKRMLDFSRKRPTQFESCRVEDVVGEAMRFVQPYLRSQLVNTNVNIECGSTLINVDRWPIVQALINLMQNAADAMAERPHRVLDISVRLESNAIQIAIADTGKGIPLPEVNNVFRPFFTTKGEHGTGLGLYITRRVVEEHGGTITLQTSDRGTTFFISLPVD